MNLLLELFSRQQGTWPTKGRTILAQFDDKSIVVYQAYRPEIGHFAAKHGYFGGDFKLGRMTWIKPNFLWMMYRSGWGVKEGQEVTLAVRLRRAAFDVRLQWDPDHDPAGKPLERRAIQLGLRGDMAVKYSREWIIGIEDISTFVAEQKYNVGNSDVMTPMERPYPVTDPLVAAKLGIR